MWLAACTDFEIVAGFLHDSVVPLSTYGNLNGASVLCQHVLSLPRHRFFCVSLDEYPNEYSFSTHFDSQFGLSSHVHLQPLMMFVSVDLRLLCGLQSRFSLRHSVGRPGLSPLLTGFYCRNLGLTRAIILDPVATLH